MKKLLALMLVFVMVFAFVACNNDQPEESKSESVPAVEQSTDEKSEEPSEPEASEPEASEPEASEPEASEPETSEPEVSTEPEPELPDYIPGFVYVDGETYAMAPTSGFSLRLTKIDDIAVEGDVVCFTPAFGSSIAVSGEDYADYAILVAEYDPTRYKYYKKDIIAVDADVDKSEIAIPEDGFVVAIHKYQKKMLAVLDKVTDKDLYPCNFNPNDFSYEIKKTDTPFDIDGVVGYEWNEFHIDYIDETNPNWDYSQFDLKAQAAITADYYMAWHEDGIYFAVVVNAEQCKWLADISDTNKSDMWSATCIQVNTCDQSPLTDYMLEHAQWANDKNSSNDDHVRQLGFSGSDTGESYACVWIGGTHTEIDSAAEYCCVWDPDNTTITYEVFLPYVELNINPDEIGEGYEFSISISINSTVEGSWKNIRARNGGGIIGMNEFTKMPVCTMA